MLSLYSCVTCNCKALQVSAILTLKDMASTLLLSSEQKQRIERVNEFFMIPPSCVVADFSRLISAVLVDIQVITPWTFLATVHKNYGAQTRKPPRDFTRSEQIGRPIHILICFCTILQGWSLILFVCFYFSEPDEYIAIFILIDYIAFGYKRNLRVFVAIRGENNKKKGREDDQIMKNKKRNLLTALKHSGKNIMLFRVIKL